MRNPLENFLFRLQDHFKHCFWAQKFFFERKISWEFPLSLNIESTNACNLNCYFCPRTKSNRQVGFIDLGLYKKILEELSLYGPREVLTLIKDGEPLMHPQIEKLVSLAKEKKVAKRVEFFTNGVLLDRQMGEKIIDSGLDVMYVSLDAVSGGTYQKIKGASLYEKVVGNLKNFLKLKRRLGAKAPHTVAKFVKTPENEGEAEEFKKIWQEACEVAIYPLHNYGGGLTGPGPVRQGRWPCLVLWFNPVVNWDGKVTTCCVNYLENELIMGEIREIGGESLAKVWQNEKYRKLRRDHLNGVLTDWPTCQKCDYWQNFVDLGDWLRKHEAP